MKITVLGSGTGVPRPNRRAPGYFLQFDGYTALLDSGPGTLQRLVTMGADFRLLDALFYTHTHPDHITDLIPLLFALKYTPGFRREAPLFIFGPAPLKDFLANAVPLYGDWLNQLPFELILQLDKAKSLFNTIFIDTAKMNHSIPTLGYRFESTSGHSFVYSGDTDKTPALIQLAQNADLALMECSFPDSQKMKGHLTPREAGQIASEAGVRHLVLTHFYPPCDEIDPVASVRAHFSGLVTLAQDGMILEIE